MKGLSFFYTASLLSVCLFFIYTLFWYKPKDNYETKHQISYSETIDQPFLKETTRLKSVIKNYVLYNELVKRGFDISLLDNVQNAHDFKKVFLPYLYDDEGRCVDNHFTIEGLGSSVNTYTNVDFINKYGTKKDLLDQGYVLNETMFYYPSNGDLDYRIGYLSVGHHATIDSSILLFGNKSGEQLYVSRSENAVLIKFNRLTHQLDAFKSAIRNYNVVVIDFTMCSGGYLETAERLADIISKNRNKKFYILTTETTASAAEHVIYRTQKLNNVKVVGTNTNGAICTGYDGVEKCTHTFEQLGLVLRVPNMAFDNQDFKNIEGVGIMPDYWATTIRDIAKAVSQSSMVDADEIDSLFY